MAKDKDPAKGFGAVQCPDCLRIGKQGESSGHQAVKRRAVIKGRARTVTAFRDCRTCGGLGIIDDPRGAR